MRSADQLMCSLVVSASVAASGCFATLGTITAGGIAVGHNRTIDARPPLERAPQPTRPQAHRRSVGKWMLAGFGIGIVMDAALLALLFGGGRGLD